MRVFESQCVDCKAFAVLDRYCRECEYYQPIGTMEPITGVSINATSDKQTDTKRPDNSSQGSSGDEYTRQDNASKD